mgnify:CR=1 FL=1
MLNYSGSGIETTFTQGEDACLTSLVAELPEAGAQKSLLIAGSLPDVVEDQFARMFRELNIPCAFLPGRKSSSLPKVGANSRVLMAQPFLGDTARALTDRGARIIAAPFPFGAEGTRLWLQAAAEEFGVSQQLFEAVTGPAFRRAQTALAEHRTRMQGKRIFFFPDSQLEVPLARFAARELGMVLEEVGTPYLHAQHMAQELAFNPRQHFGG